MSKCTLSLGTPGRGELLWWRVTGGVLDTSATLGPDGRRVKGSSLLCSGIPPPLPAEQRQEPGTEQRGAPGEPGAEQAEQLCPGLHNPTQMGQAGEATGD